MRSGLHRYYITNMNSRVLAPLYYGDAFAVVLVKRRERVTTRRSTGRNSEIFLKPRADDSWIDDGRIERSKYKSNSRGWRRRCGGRKGTEYRRRWRWLASPCCVVDRVRVFWIVPSGLCIWVDCEHRNVQRRVRTWELLKAGIYCSIGLRELVDILQRTLQALRSTHLRNAVISVTESLSTCMINRWRPAYWLCERGTALGRRKASRDTDVSIRSHYGKVETFSRINGCDFGASKRGKSTDDWLERCRCPTGCRDDARVGSVGCLMALTGVKAGRCSPTN